MGGATGGRGGGGGKTYPALLWPVDTLHGVQQNSQLTSTLRNSASCSLLLEVRRSLH